MKDLIKVDEEYASPTYFGRFDLRINRIIQYLFEEGEIHDITDRAFGDAIGRQPSTVFGWRSYRSFPNSVSLILMYKRFGVDIHWLCGLKGQSLDEAFVNEKLRAAA